MKQRGMALITVLLMLAFMAALAVASQRQWRMTMQQNQLLQQQQQRKWTVLGAEQWLLKHPPGIASGKSAGLMMENEQVYYRWQDRQACFNLNALSMPTHDNGWRTRAQHIFARLLQQHGLTESQIVDVLAAIDNHWLSSRNRNADPFLDDKSQLRELAALSKLHWDTLASQLCTLPSTRLQININALTDRQIPLLMAMLDGHFNQEELQSILSRRPQSGWNTVDDFIRVLPKIGNTLASGLQSVAVTQSEYWELQVWSAGERHAAPVVLRSQLQWKNSRLQQLYRQHGISESL